MSDIITTGNKQDKWTLKVTELLNWLNDNKSAVLVAGDNITLTPKSDGRIEISAEGGGGGGDVTDVQIDNTSILDQYGVANITTMTGATAQANGVKGLVPAPLIADKEKYLKGDGTWAEVSSDSEHIQVDTMPTASSTELGNIYQYVGTTDSNYTNGYFYKCVTVEPEATYEDPNGNFHKYYTEVKGDYYQDYWYKVYADKKLCYCRVSSSSENYYLLGLTYTNDSYQIGELNTRQGTTVAEIVSIYPSFGYWEYDGNYQIFQWNGSTPSRNNSTQMKYAYLDSNLYLAESLEDAFAYLTASNYAWVRVDVQPSQAGGNVYDVEVNGVSVVDANKVAKIVSYKEVTQQEYDALPNSKNYDGVLYCIKDAGIVEGEQFSPVIYSLEEREIGTWVNGKPLYQKTVYIANLPSTSGVQYYPHNISNIENVCYVYGGTYNTSTGGTTPLNDSIPESSPVTADTFGVRATRTDISIFVGYDRSSLSAYVTLLYTKTTDVPGQGHWGTTGVPMVHYDGTEKIVGTWFGETLYEKTFDATIVSELQSNVWVATDVIVTGATRIIDIEALYLAGTGNLSLIAYLGNNYELYVMNLRNTSYGINVQSKITLRYIK